ncbi:MAG: SecE/Sec61-gamma subunit of protein translocation complex [Acidobacteriota bacterium]|nr:SecE/Sec61-gamma subunit of protein translocation complex [Acidobacteriota bacterium]MDT7807651.1 SecE/Sec61-gamma subunit of protein translocation complex [Acidobacteriota bacterium]
MTASHDEPGDLPGTPEGGAPRMARYGEGPEGRPARRERAQAEHPRDGFFERTGKFVRDVRAELGRTSWPTALQVRNTTIITIFAVIFFATYLFVVDRLFAFLLDQVARLVGAA